MPKHHGRDCERASLKNPITREEDVRTIREIKQFSMLKIYVTSIGDKLILECYDPWVNKKPKQKVVPVYIFTSRGAKQHYWNMFQKFPDNWRFEK